MRTKNFKLAIIIILLQIVLSLYFGLPLSNDVKVPSHWNIRGEIDGYMGKWSAILIFPGINIILLLLMLSLPIISVRYQKATERFDLIIPQIANIIIFFFAIIHIYTLLIGTELVSATGSFIYYALGLMFILLGNILPKIPSSFYIGIRTPWTLSSEQVWRKTHKIGGICFVMSGLLMLFYPAFWGNNATALTIMFILFMLIILYPVLYSFILFKQKDVK